jgi:hypothetical protein
MVGEGTFDALTSLHLPVLAETLADAAAPAAEAAADGGGLMDMLGSTAYTAGHLLLLQYALSINRCVRVGVRELVYTAVHGLVLARCRPAERSSTPSASPFNQPNYQRRFILVERDRFLAESISKACTSNPGSRVAAVLGLLHCNGVARHLSSMGFELAEVPRT